MVLTRASSAFAADLSHGRGKILAPRIPNRRPGPRGRAGAELSRRASGRGELARPCSQGEGCRSLAPGQRAQPGTGTMPSRALSSYHGTHLLGVYFFPLINLWMRIEGGDFTRHRCVCSCSSTED